MACWRWPARLIWSSASRAAGWRVNPDGPVRGRRILTLTGGNPLRLRLPPEAETPYGIQTSMDLHHWSDWLEDDYPWWPFDRPVSSGSGARFFRAQPAREPHPRRAPSGIL